MDGRPEFHQRDVRMLMSWLPKHSAVVIRRVELLSTIGLRYAVRQDLGHGHTQRILMGNKSIALLRAMIPLDLPIRLSFLMTLPRQSLDRGAPTTGARSQQTVDVGYLPENPLCVTVRGRHLLGRPS